MHTTNGFITLVQFASLNEIVCDPVQLGPHLVSTNGQALFTLY